MMAREIETVERPIQIVRDYLALRREWDLSTTEQATVWKRGDPVDPERPLDIDRGALEEAWVELGRLRQQWFTP